MLNFPKSSVRCRVEASLRKIRLVSDDYCKECQEEEETIEHLVGSFNQTQSKYVLMSSNCAYNYKVKNNVFSKRIVVTQTKLPTIAGLEL